MEVFIVIASCYYSEEDHDFDIERVFSSRSDADSYCSSLNGSCNDPYLLYSVESYKVY